MDTFKTLLGTPNKKKQIERIKELLQIEAMPEITLQVRYNGIADDVAVDVTGGDVPFAVLHHMLDLTAAVTRKEEVKAAINMVEDGKVPEE